MSRPTSSQSDSEWAEAFQQAIAASCRKPVGPGWKTMRELMAEHGVSERTVSVRLCGLVKAGKVERFEGTEKRAEWSRANKQTWYRLAPKKK